ncbi:uncharacterized protein LOC105908561 isoform X2 [Clupea harengus]|uniref:Uncharacterized protein LOC105908561 isoform X2 n=1 Tax=Clupea harengus TaxID=7950 RepID=A0A6P8EXR2_CLUHA|nr:uncharacterized protein LOC105908561 isoform X2 [Clupea harengus]
MRTLFLPTALTVCWFLVEAKPQIKMFPNYGQVYAGDTVILKCSEIPTNKWLFRGQLLEADNQSLILPAASQHSAGDYQCVTAEKSDKFTLRVLDLLAPALLEVLSKNAVVYKNTLVPLQLYVDEGLTDWKCYIARKDTLFHVQIPEDEMTSKTSITFFVEARGENPEIVFCNHKTRGRSNSISLRSTEMEVLLEIPPRPAMLGEPLTLKCEVQGGAEIKTAVFYKDGAQIQTTSDGSYKISAVTDKDQGSYRCKATYRYTYTNPHGAFKEKVDSEPQTLNIRARPPSAVIAHDASTLECSCSAPDCPAAPRFHWYYQESGTAVPAMHTKDAPRLLYDQPGLYACQAFWDDGVSRRSQLFYAAPDSKLIIYVVLALIIAGVLCVAIAFLFLKKRREDSAGQRDVPMKSMRRKKAGEEDDEAKDDAYQSLNETDKNDYHTLQQGDGADGGYEAVGGARSGDGGDGGYEALKAKEQSDVYHSLQPTETPGADGGYEALKGTKQSDTYETLKPTAEGGGDGGVEAIKGSKASATGEESEEKGVYQKLGTDGGDGVYEELGRKRQEDNKED